VRRFGKVDCARSLGQRHAARRHAGDVYAIVLQHDVFRRDFEHVAGRLAHFRAHHFRRAADGAGTDDRRARRERAEAIGVRIETERSSKKYNGSLWKYWLIHEETGQGIWDQVCRWPQESCCCTHAEIEENLQLFEAEIEENLQLLEKERVWVEYPAPQNDFMRVGSGSMIESYFYNNHKDAIAASEAAEHNAKAFSITTNFVPPGDLNWKEDRNQWEVAVVVRP